MSDWELDTPPKKAVRAPQGQATGAASESAPQDRSKGAVAPAAGPEVPAPAVRDVDPGDGAAGTAALPVAGAPATAGATAVPPPKRRRIVTLLGWVAAGLVILIVGALIGFFISRSQADSATADLVEAQKELGLVEKALSQAEERNWNYYRENEALMKQIEDLQSGGQPPGQTTTSTTAPSGAGRVYRDGIYMVGEDISIGTYDGLVVGDQGYWARLRATDGIVSSIVANGLPRGPFVLTIVESDKAVELRGVELTAQ